MVRGIFSTNTAKNRPFDGWCTILSMPINGNTTFNMQIAVAINSTSLYVRSCNNGVYSNWRKI